MHGCSSESAFLVNAEVDSMGGVIDGIVGIDTRNSPCRAEIERAQEEIRLEIDSREERLRELEFLEKGGDPLDFEFSRAVSVSVQSTSLTDQQPEQIVTSKAKDVYVSTALRSQHGEAAESIGKPGDTTCEANSGDNLLLFDDENKLFKDKNFKDHTGKNAVPPSVISPRTGGNHKAKASENSAIFRPYARRNRSKSNRDGARTASMDISHARNQGSAQFRHGTRDTKGSLVDANRKDQKLSSSCKLKSSTRIHDMAKQNDDILDVESAVKNTADKQTNLMHGGCKELAVDAKTNGELLSSRKDHEIAQDATSCGAGIEAHETIELANCGSLVSDATTATLQTGIASQSDVAITEKTNDTHIDIQPPKSVRDSCANLQHHTEPILVADEVRKSVIEDPLEIDSHHRLVDPGYAVVGGDGTHNDSKSGPLIKVEEDADLQNKSFTDVSLETSELKEDKDSKVLNNSDNVTDHNCSPRKGDTDTAQVQTSIKTPLVEISESQSTPSGEATANKDVPEAACDKKLTDKMNEDSILAEAKIILANRKRIAELSMRSFPLKNCQKSHWDFLLEEMAWLANDFMQERIWKVTGAAQLGRHAALSSHTRDQKQMPVRRLRFVAHSLAKAVMEFWRTSEMLDGPDSLEPQSHDKSFALKSYALRFLKYNSSTTPSIKVEDPASSNDMHDLSMQEPSGESCITDEDLFYAIPPGAMQCYRTSVESYVLQCEKNGSMQKEDVLQIHEANEDMSRDNVYDQYEGDTGTHCLPGTLELSKASQLPHKKQKHIKRTYSSGSYELGADFAYGNHMPGTQKAVITVKRPSTQNHVSIPTKRMRTASRQRGAGTVNMLAMNKTGASSEDTNSYQDDQVSLHGGSQPQRSLEVESPVDFEKYLPTDSGEISTKHKKKKGEHSKRRLDRHHLDSNGSNGLFGLHRNKKFKISKQTFEKMLDNGALVSGSMPSPAASQMSNMANANEYKKMMSNGDRIKKTKSTKLPIPMPGSGNAWTSFEDQELVVLVHDLGPNWYLVSEAINSTLWLKHIFRQPKECKERHKLLMDQSAGDGADSADDSGSSQPYPSTMPGIPKGRAMQLFQRLRGPMEEDMVKSHFEKIIMIGRKQHHHRKQSEYRDQKHVLPPHNSHVIAITQVSSNNVNGGILMPLDLIDAMMPSPDAFGYQCPQTSGFTNQSCGPSALSPSGMPAGNSLSSPSGPISHGNGRYGVPMTSLPIDDQQRQQQLNPMLSGRNIQQSTIPIPGPRPLVDRFGPRKLQGGNGMSMVNGINSRGNPMARPGFQGLGTSPSSGMVGMQSVEMQSAVGSSQGNTNQRPIDNSHPIRPGQSLDHHRQKMVPELQMRTAQSNSHGITPINGLNGSYNGQTGPSSGQSYSVHPQQKHQPHPDLTNPRLSHFKGPNHVGSQHPAYARLVKERQLQQQILQQQQQYSASNAMMTQAQPLRPAAVSMQNNPQVQPQSSQGFSHSSLTPPSSAAPIYSQLQQKHHLPPHGNSRDAQSTASSLPNQITKQGHRHPLQQSLRPHTAQQRQQLQAQHGNQYKQEGKGNMNVTVDQSNLNGQSLSSSPVGQPADKEEHASLMQGSQNSVQPSRPIGLQTSSQSPLQQKLYSSASHPPNRMQQVPLDNGNQGTSAHLVSSPNHPLIQVPSNSHQKHFGQTQVNIPRGAENSNLVSKLDDQAMNSEAQMQQEWQTPDSLQESPMQNVSSQLGSIGSPPGSDSNLIVGPGAIQRQLSGGLISSPNSVGDRWQQKSQVSNPQMPSTSQQ